VARLLQSALALLATAAILLAGPIGSAGVAAAAEAGGQESQLEQRVDRLSPGQRAQLERQLSDRLAEAGIDLHDPGIEARLAGVLGVSQAEIGRAADAANAPAESISRPILLLFIAATLIFAPSAFKSVADTLFGWLTETAAIEGIEPF
jgi:hypothetical protein